MVSGLGRVKPDNIKLVFAACAKIPNYPPGALINISEV